MRILFDQGTPGRDKALSYRSHCQNGATGRLATLANGHLLEVAEEAGF